MSELFLFRFLINLKLHGFMDTVELPFMTNNQEFRFVSIKTKLFCLIHSEIFVSSILRSLQSVSISSAEHVNPNKSINGTRSVKLLGINIDDELKFDKHLKTLFQNVC